MEIILAIALLRCQAQPIDGAGRLRLRPQLGGLLARATRSFTSRAPGRAPVIPPSRGHARCVGGVDRGGLAGMLVAPEASVPRPDGSIRNLRGLGGPCAAGAGRTLAGLGGDVARSLAKHGRIAEIPIARFGIHGARAGLALDGRNARRLAMATRAGLFDRQPRSGELLGVIERYADRAMDFIWRNKGPFSIASVLASFLADPESYLSGALSLAGAVVGPAADHAGIPKGSGWVRSLAHASPALLLGLGACFVARRLGAVRPSLGIARRPPPGRRGGDN